MSVVAFIPARGDSKSIPDKNIKLFCGKPLIFWILEQLQESNVDEIVVATDSEKIKEVVKSFSFSKVEVYDRTKENANDDSSTESVILEYIDKSSLLESDVFMLVQATSPFTQEKHFNEGLTLFKRHDSVLSCTVDKCFVWREDGVPLSYDIDNRPRRQEYKGNLIENGAFYISTVADINTTQTRISGDIGIYKMPEYSRVELDEPLDWVIAESLMQKFVINSSYDFSKIKLFLSDVDGVLTDGGMYYTENGDEFKKFCTHDGMAFHLLQNTGIKVGILTSEDRELNRRRAKKLGLDFDFHGAIDKLKMVNDLCENEDITIDEVAYIGDDINCFDLLCNVGIAACPNNAISQIKEIPGIIQLGKNGGDGVVRQFAELILSS